MKGEKKMKIALINENSQCGKNSLIFETLKRYASRKDIRYLITADLQRTTDIREATYRRDCLREF